MTGLLGAVQFLTRIPIRMRAAATHDRIVPWFPLVGALIGAAVGATAAGLGELLPMSVAGAVAVAIGLLITGAFHEDGLADIADAFGGGWTRERRFEILKDSRHGTYGVAALTSSIAIRILALGTIAGPAPAFASAVAAHTLARSAAVAAMTIFPPATESGLGADHARRLRRLPTALGIASGIAISVLATGWWTLPLAAAATGAVLATGLLAMRKIGGLAGDVLGAIEQVAECLVLVVACGIAAHHPLWWS
jgi:adenosylcobinamide-GDP ribazoletransferase